MAAGGSTGRQRGQMAPRRDDGRWIDGTTARVDGSSTGRRRVRTRRWRGTTALGDAGRAAAGGGRRNSGSCPVAASASRSRGRALWRLWSGVVSPLARVGVVGLGPNILLICWVGPCRISAGLYLFSGDSGCSGNKITFPNYPRLIREIRSPSRKSCRDFRVRVNRDRDREIRDSGFGIGKYAQPDQQLRK